MTERRPHWSDELIEAVQQADEIDCKVRYCDDCTYAVIAAVEDNKGATNE